MPLLSVFVLRHLLFLKRTWKVSNVLQAAMYYFEALGFDANV